MRIFPRRLISLLCAAWLLYQPGFAMAEERPNVLLICADDLAPYVVGAYGNDKVRTPNIDRLAKEGMRFDRAYCNSPVCTASRQSFLTGRYPRTIGVTQLRTPLPESELTLAEMLQPQGYQTAAIGKMHFNSDLPHGFDHRLDRADHQRYLRQNGRESVEGIDVLPPWRPFRDPARIWLNADVLPYGAVDADMAGTYFAEEAVEYLDEHGEEQFFLMVSFYEPHSPFHFPVEYRDRHSPAEFEAPPISPNDAWQIPEIFEPLSEADIRGIRASYYTSVEFLDKNVGIVLDGLEARGLRDNTIVVFMGDHGYMLGQHGRIEKHCSYEPAVRSPLIVRYPPAVEESVSSDAFVEFVDIVPTILGLAGMQVPDPVQGSSFAPVLTGDADEHRDHIVVEYSENEEAMIRTDRWKLVYMTGNRERQDGYITSEPIPEQTVLLFDLDNDPEELRNVADDPEFEEVKTRLLSDLVAHMRKTSRLPGQIPITDDPHEILAHCLQPRDLVPE